MSSSQQDDDIMGGSSQRGGDGSQRGSQRGSRTNRAGAPSQYERRLARQRELERMEMAASGMAPDMHIDTSEFVGAGIGIGIVTPTGVPSAAPTAPEIRSRPATSGSLLSSQQAPLSNIQVFGQPLAAGGGIGIGGGAAAPSAVGARAAPVFVRPNAGLRGSTASTGINLMDHEAAVYAERKSLGTRIGEGFAGIFRVDDDVSRQFDASAADAGDDYGIGKPYGQQPKRASPLYSKLRHCLRTKYGRRCLFTAAILLVVATALAVVYKPQSQVIYERNLSRYEEIVQVIEDGGLTSIRQLRQNHSSPEYHALRWIAYMDPLRLDPRHENFLERYALVVFFYSSYQIFERHAGKQKSVLPEGVDDPDKVQWEGTPNAGWMRQDYWLSGKAHCLWWGVGCHPELEHRDNDDKRETATHYDSLANVISIDLKDNHVYGTIPPEFKAFESLTYIDFTNNKVSGTFPWQVARMFRIQHVLLANNQMTGTIPTQIGMMEALKELRWGNNKLVGTIPTEISRLWSLQHLSLENNHLSGPLPDLGESSRLHTLWLDANKLNGTIPASFGNLISMQEMHLHNNRLTGSIPVNFTGMVNLEQLVIDDNYLTGKLDNKVMQSWVSLKHLSLEHNLLSGELPYHIGELKNLEVLELNNNKFTGVLPGFFNILNIQRIHLHENQLDFVLPTSFGRFHKLESLWLHKNKMDRTIPTELGNCAALTSLYLEHNTFTGTVPTELGKLTNLKELRIFDNLLTGKVPATVCELKVKSELLTLQSDCNDDLECHCCQCMSRDDN